MNSFNGFSALDYLSKAMLEEIKEEVEAADEGMSFRLSCEERPTTDGWEVVVTGLTGKRCDEIPDTTIWSYYSRESALELLNKELSKL